MIIRNNCCIVFKTVGGGGGRGAVKTPYINFSLWAADGGDEVRFFRTKKKKKKKLKNSAAHIRYYSKYVRACII